MQGEPGPQCWALRVGPSGTSSSDSLTLMYQIPYNRSAVKHWASVCFGCAFSAFYANLMSLSYCSFKIQKNIIIYWFMSNMCYYMYIIYVFPYSIFNAQNRQLYKLYFLATVQNSKQLAGVLPTCLKTKMMESVGCVFSLRVFEGDTTFYNLQEFSATVCTESSVRMPVHESFLHHSN